MNGRRQRSNQELRTPKDHLQAAARQLKAGRKPNMDEVAREALVSRATAYRHFKNVDALLVEAPIDAAVRTPEEILSGLASEDPEERIDYAEADMHRTVYENEAQLRLMMAQSLTLALENPDVPVRQNRRLPLIEAALAHVRDQLEPQAYQKLCYALAVLFGPEAMIVFRDVLRTDEPTARAVKSWAVRALVRAARPPRRRRDR